MKSEIPQRPDKSPSTVPSLAVVRRAGPAAPAWLLRSRVGAPPHPWPLVKRQRLLAHLRSLEGAAVLVLNAPPGYGKTVALSQMNDAMVSSGARVAWLTLAAIDDAETVVDYLAFAFQGAGLKLPEGLLADSRDRVRQPGPLRLQALLATLERAGDPWMLVLDDAEQATPEVVRDVLSPLVSFMPAVLRIAFGTRGPCPVDLAKASLRGLVGWIGPERLRLDRTEIRIALGGSPGNGEVQQVEERSAGWPALVQLVGERGPFVPGGTGPALPGLGALEFVEKNLLGRLDQADRAFALRLSVLPTFWPELLDRLFESTDSRHQLERLTWLGLVSPDPTIGVSRFTMHKLFRDHFAQCFDTEAPVEATALRRQSALLLLAAGRHADAVQVAVQTSDPRFVAEIFGACEPFLHWFAHGLPWLLELVRPVPEELKRSDPRIAHAAIVCRLKAGQVREAQAQFEDAVSRFPEGAQEMASGASPVRVERALCKVMLFVYRGSAIPEADMQQLEDLADANAAYGPGVRCLVASLESHRLQQAGDFEAAKEKARAAIAHAERVDSKHAAFFMRCDVAMMTGLQGRVREAVELFDACDRECQAVIRGDERLALIRGVFRLELEHELDPANLRDIAQLQNICIRLPRLEGWLDVFAAAFRTCSEKVFLAGDLTGALATLSVGADSFRKQAMPAAARTLMAQRVILLACSGRQAEAAREFADIDPVTESPTWREKEVFAEAAATLALFGGTHAPQPLLDTQIALAIASGNVRTELRLRRLQAALGGGVPTSAVDAIDAIETTTGFTRSRRLLVGSVSSARGGTPELDITKRGSFFSEREREVLERIVAGSPDKLIAKQLGISVHGVRFHLNKIYKKLSVSSRGEVRAKAAELDVLVE